MPGKHDIIVLGASMGGVEALTRLVAALPGDLPAALFVVTHIPTGYPSALADILNRAGPLPAAQAQSGEPIQPGRIYVAVPDRHLLLAPGVVKVEPGPRENGFRPAIDPLFRSAARHYGPRVVGVVLTGAGVTDGVAGLLAVRAAGGVAVIQDPADAFMPVLPRSALAIAGADHVVPMAQLPELLTRLVAAPAEGATRMADPVEKINQTILHDTRAQADDQLRGQRSYFSCPECGGALWQVDDAGVMQFSCHVGHLYYGEQLLAENSEHLEAALWSAVRIFKERATLAHQLAHRERQRGDDKSAQRFDEQAAVAEDYYQLIQDHILAVMPAAPKPQQPDG